MNEGVGSTSILVVIVVFIAFASAYMAYNVNYTKAFRMKNKIVAMYEKYDGNCDSTCVKAIKRYAQKIGYVSARPDQINYCSNPKLLPQNGTIVEITSMTDPGFCIYKIMVDVPTGDKYEVVKDLYNGDQYYYHVLTCINIEMPIVQSAVPRFLAVSGDTKVFREFE